MIIKKPRQWKYQLLIALAVALFMELAFASIVMADVVQSLEPVYFDEVMTGGTMHDANAPFSNFAIFVPTGLTFDRIQWASPDVPGAGLWRPKNYFGGYYKLLLNAGYPGQTANTWINISPGNITRISSTTVEWVFGSVTVTPDRTHLLFNLPDDGLDYHWRSNFYRVPPLPWDTDPGIKSASSTYGYNTSGSTIQNGGPGYRLCNGPCDSFEPVPEFDITPLPTNFDIPGPYEDTFNTRFTDVSVAGPNTAVEFDIDYFLDTTEYNSNTRPDIINITVLQHKLFSDPQVDGIQKLILPLADGDQNKVITSDHVYDDDNYTAFINFWNLNRNNFTFSETSIVVEFDINGGVVTDFEIVEITNGLELDLTPEYEECGVTNIGGCINNSLKYLFYPSATVLNDFGDVWQELSQLAPFGYITSGFSAMSSLGTTASSTWSFGNIPFQTAIFDPIRTSLAPILWGIYGIFFYKRIRSIEF